MSKPFDPYATWLGIPPEKQPADYYRLLGVDQFEDDLDLLAKAADERMARIRTYQTGPRGMHTQAILNELSAARVCLLNVATKASYDQMLMGLLMAGDPTAEDPAAVEPAPAVNSQAQRPVPITTARPIKVARKSRRQDPVNLLGFWALGAVFALVAVGVAWWMFHGGEREPSPSPGNSQQQAFPFEEPDSDARSAVLEPVTILQEGDGSLHFEARTAELHGPSIHAAVANDVDVITAWESEDDWVSWHFKLFRLPPNGAFQVEITYAAKPDANGGEFVLVVDGREVACSVRGTGQPVTDERVLVVSKTGEQTLEVRPRRVPGERLMTLKSIVFRFP